MKKIIKKSVICLTATAAMLSGMAATAAPLSAMVPTIVASAATTQTEYTDPTTGVKFVLNNNKATITGVKAGVTSLTIPSTVKTSTKSSSYTVTGLKDGAFKNNTTITKVLFPQSVPYTDIPYECFSGCTKLVDVTFPLNLKRISTQAFYHCTALKTLSIPAYVTNLYHNTFDGCTSLTTVTLGAGTKLESLGWGTFANCTNLSKFCVASGEFTPPQGITNNYVYLPKTLWGPTSETFKNCPKIEHAYFYKDSVSNWSNSFDYPRVELRYVDGFEQHPISTTTPADIVDQTYTDSKTNVFTWNFVDANNPSAGLIIKNVNVKNGAVTIPSTITYKGTSYKVVETASGLLDGNTKVTSIVFGDNIKTIGGGCACNTTNLTTITLPKNVESIGYASFYNSKKLANVKYSGTALSDLADFCFFVTPWMDNYEANHSKADGIILGNFLIKFLGDKSTANNSHELNVNCNTGIYAYDEAKGKYEYKTVRYIGYRAFQSINVKKYLATDLKTINLSGVQKIYDGAFQTCSNLVSVYGGNDVKWLGKDLFHTTTQNKLKKETSNQSYVLIGSSLYKWLSTGTTADLSSVNLTCISKFAFEGTNVTTLKLSNNFDNLKMPEQVFINTKINNIYVGGTQFTYNNVQNQVGKMSSFYNKYYAALEGCKATKNNFLNPLCKKILGEIGVTYYGSVKSDSVLPVAKKIAAAGEIYRYCERNFHYIYTEGGSGEFTLYSNRGQCGPQARAYAYLLNAAGIQSEIVGSCNHAWDIIKLGNNWYNADVCWKNLGVWFLRSQSEYNAIDESCHTCISTVSNDPACIAYGIATSGASIPARNKTMGDINNDGKVDSTDVNMIDTAGHYAVSYDTTYGDVDGDGKVTSRDAEFLRMRLKKLGK